MRNIISRNDKTVKIIFRPAALILASSEGFKIKQRGAWQDARHTQRHRQKYAGMKRCQTAGPRLILKLQNVWDKHVAQHRERLHGARQDTNQVSKAEGMALVEASD